MEYIEQFKMFLNQSNELYKEVVMESGEVFLEFSKALEIDDQVIMNAFVSFDVEHSLVLLSIVEVAIINDSNKIHLLYELLNELNTYSRCVNFLLNKDDGTISAIYDFYILEDPNFCERILTHIKNLFIEVECAYPDIMKLKWT